MGSEKIIDRSIINGRAIVTTAEVVRPGMLVGVHPCLETTVSGVDGINPIEPYRLYINQHAAKVGHNIVCDEIGRLPSEMRAISEGSHQSLSRGAL